MMGPSAPKGPPVPIAIAADSGFKIATRGWMRLRLKATASMASGMPWPLIFGEPYLAKADNEAADHRDEDDPRPPRGQPGAGKGKRAPVIKRQVGEQSDQLVENERDYPGRQPDSAGQARHQANTKVRRGHIPVQVLGRKSVGRCGRKARVPTILVPWIFGSHC